jgi:hypothetical protein
VEYVKPIRHALAEAARAIGLVAVALVVARRRTKRFRSKGRHANCVAAAAERKADLLRGEQKPARAAYQDRKAARARHRASKAHGRAQFQIGRVKALVRQKHQLDQSQAHLRDELQAWLKEHGVQIVGNKAKGGTAHKRWVAVCLASVANCAHGVRRNFYSMVGGWDIKHVIRPGEANGERSDCSSTVTGWAWSAGLPDPNGANWSGGFTGTLVGEHNGWHRVSETELKKRGWGYVVYGPGNGHHTEAYIGPGDRTAGHGSAPVDFGVINLFGDGDYRCYVCK